MCARTHVCVHTCYTNIIAHVYIVSYEFREHLVLGEFLKEAEATPAHYTLQVVLVHSGD